MWKCLTTFIWIFEYGAVDRPRCIDAVWWFLLRGRVLRPEDACQKRFSYKPLCLLSDNNRKWFFCGTFSSMERGTPTDNNRKMFSASKSVLLAGKIIDGDLREANWKYSNVLSDHFQQAFFSSFLFSFLIRWRIDFKSFENKNNLKTQKHKMP